MSVLLQYRHFFCIFVAKILTISCHDNKAALEVPFYLKALVIDINNKI